MKKISILESNGAFNKTRDEYEKEHGKKKVVHESLLKKEKKVKKKKTGFRQD